MIHILKLFFSMPLILQVKLILLMRGPRPHGERLTANDLMMRAKAIDELVRSLPVPKSEIEAATLISILSWLDNELDKIAALQQAHFIVAGTVPVFHDSTITRSN